MGFICSICGELHEGLAAWAFKRPDYWLSLTQEERAKGRANDDLCQTSDGHFFVRAVMVLPIVDGPEDDIELGVWGSLSEANFGRYLSTFDDPDQSKLGPMFSYLSNAISQFPGCLNLHADFVPQDDGQRPIVELHESEHPLAVAQRRGIHFDDALAILHQRAVAIEPFSGELR